MRVGLRTIEDCWNVVSSGEGMSYGQLEELREKNKLLEKQLDDEAKTAAMFRLAVESSPSSMVMVDDQGNIVLVNAETEKLFGYTREELIGRGIEILIPNGSRGKHGQLVKEYFRTPVTRALGADTELKGLRKDGTEIPLEIGLNPIHTETGDFVLSAIIDITERRRAAETASRLASLVENSHDAIVGKNLEGIILSWNRAAERIYGYSAEEAVGKHISLIVPPERHGELGEVMKKIGQGDVVPALETKRRRKDGKEILVSLTISPLRRKDGTLIGASTIARDISERKRAEDEMKNSLHEKELLLKEVHHRVKNNMQVISSLLKLQARYVKNPEASRLFEESQNRVRSMALVHEKLYQSRALAKIDFSDYIRHLSNELYQTYVVDPTRIRMEVRVDTVELGIDNAIPCGLIVNELLSNCLKHSFNDGRDGIIEISLQRCDDVNIKLVVADNGRGLPPGLEVRKPSSLGMLLINTLSDQLKGKLEFTSAPDAGCRFEVTFPNGAV